MRVMRSFLSFSLLFFSFFFFFFVAFPFFLAFAKTGGCDACHETELGKAAPSKVELVCATKWKVREELHLLQTDDAFFFFFFLLCGNLVIH